MGQRSWTIAVLAALIAWVAPISGSQLISDLSYIIEKRSLPLASFRTGLACTGSMEPRFTCLDEVTVVTEFSPEKIRPGEVIVFTSPEGEDLILHRVLKTKQEKGEILYWTKGDANDLPDGWWVSEEEVTGYVSNTHKNVRMENSFKRQIQQMQRAKESSDRFKRQVLSR